MSVTMCIFLLQRLSCEAESKAYKYLANYHLKQGNLDVFPVTNCIFLLQRFSFEAESEAFSKLPSETREFRCL